MRNMIFLIAALTTAATPVEAQRPASTAAHADRYSNAASVFKARIASIDLRIDMLRDGRVLSAAEADELRATSRDLERRLHGMSRRDASDIQTALAQLERRVGYVMDDSRWGRHAYQRSDILHVDGRPYEGGRDSDYKHFDRYTAPPVDRWHDPFDRGN